MAFCMSMLSWHLRSLGVPQARFKPHDPSWSFLHIFMHDIVKPRAWSGFSHIRSFHALMAFLFITWGFSFIFP